MFKKIYLLYFVIVAGVAAYYFLNDNKQATAIISNITSTDLIKKELPVQQKNNSLVSNSGPSSLTLSNKVSDDVNTSVSTEDLAILEELNIDIDDDRVEYIYADDGRVIKEVDNDVSSPFYKKPLKLYQHTDDKIVSVIQLHYVGHRIERTRLDVAYNEDGSIKDYRRSEKY